MSRINEEITRDFSAVRVIGVVIRFDVMSFRLCAAKRNLRNSDYTYMLYITDVTFHNVLINCNTWVVFIFGVSCFL